MDDAFMQADKLYSDKCYEDAFKIFYELAEGGDSDAMSRVAVMLGAGEGVELNIKKSIEWDLKSIELGNNISLYNIGFNYIKIGDIDAAVKWFKRSADNGDVDASLELLRIFKNFNLKNFDISRYFEMALSDELTRDEAVEIAREIYRGTGNALGPTI